MITEKQKMLINFLLTASKSRQNSYTFDSLYKREILLSKRSRRAEETRTFFLNSSTRSASAMISILSDGFRVKAVK